MSLIKSISLIFILSLAACQNQTKKKELELKEKELELMERELALEKKKNEIESKISTIKTHDSIQQVADIPVKEFGYVVFKVNKPELRTFESKNTIVDNPFDDIPPMPEVPDRTIVLYQTYIYTSKVIELSDGNQDEVYRIMDFEEEKVQAELNRYNAMFKDELITAPSDVRNAFRNSHAKIVDRKMRKFKTYEEASRHLSKNYNNFD